jgi:hypothetical protein
MTQIVLSFTAITAFMLVGIVGELLAIYRMRDKLDTVIVLLGKPKG